ncbi:MAG: acyl-CoA dehydrogenase [Planctomycetes bacterium]|jgi:glutaryl-CoA dehydrogenase|nr:acyl-CoA dehydrogenase [Planctomycetota bacterium]MBT6452888.1 acyl-CoA dehydrogenase [Planctomycetota bacterium]MBT6541578.1 acyl-CoA dehydrogenase [Planctomycetota bacterium]MBT6783695.1 acyl-CoA dehydrogenase [Planctomycetota bacterium]MBT6967497.1 acyl-CoA dehydrogenase [Planctomycetota bacterium]
MEQFEGSDFYNLDDLLTEEQRLIRDTVREFVDDQVVPCIEDCFMTDRFPLQIIPTLGELGLLGANLNGYDCAGLDNISYGLIMQELERGDSGVRSFVSVQGGLVMYPIHRYGSDEQKDKFLPQLASGKMIGCFGLTEPDHGSDPSGMITHAVEDGDEYVLNGNKMWITNGCISDVAVVWAKLDDRIRGFLVEKGSPGFTTTKQEKKFSLRASTTSELHFQDCRIPKANLLPGADGLAGPLTCLTQARYGIAWGVVGSAMACFDAAKKYSLSRIQFDRPIGGFQLVQAKLAEMLSEITKAQLLCLRLAQLKDSGKMTAQQVSLSKRNNVYWALEIARSARDLLGANGVTHEYPVGRHMLNLESVKTYEGTHDIHTLILGHEITGIPAYK